MSTLDARVQAKVAGICSRQQQGPALRQELLTRRAELAAMDLRCNPEAYMDAQDKIQALEDELQGLEEADAQYLLQAIPYLKDSALKTSTVTGASAFDKTFGKLVKVQKSCKKGNIFNKYLLEVENDPQASINVSMDHSVDCMCVECNVPLQVDPHLCMLVCPECGLSRQYLENTGQNLTYDQEQHMQRVTLFAYKRSNHLLDTLNSVCGRENTQIKPEILDSLRAELRKDKVTKSTEITPARIKRYLKKLKQTSLYEHATYITQLLNGKPPPTFSPELEQKLITMFNLIQEPFDKHKDEKRQNSLSYCYLLYKILELLGEDWALSYFPLLKCAEKLHTADMTWKKICKELLWQYIPSV